LTVSTAGTDGVTGAVGASIVAATTEPTTAEAGAVLAREVEGDSTPYPVTIATAKSSTV
jgi:hypothetical protein